MRQQIRAIRRLPLLDKRGRLNQPSWASEDNFIYNKDQLRPGFGRKEWEFYQLSNRHFVLQLCYGRTAYTGLVSAALIDLDTGRRYSCRPRKPFPGDSLDLDFSPGEVHRVKYEDLDLFLAMDFDGAYRRLLCHTDSLSVDLMFPEEGDALAVAVPFARKSQFYYGFTKNFLDVRGEVLFNGMKHNLDHDSFVVLNSGRGIWPHESNWVWANGSTHIGAHVLSINLGWGFGRPGAGTQNAIFWDGAIQKLYRVREQCDLTDLMQPARFLSDDGRLDVRFTPRYDNYDARHYLLYRSRRHQVFGTLSGRCLLEDGTPVEISDMPFFCEHAHNRW